MRIIFLIGFIAALNLGGCSSTLEWARMNTYNFEAQRVELEGEKFDVYRHKTDKSLMVSPVAASPAPPKFVTPLMLDEKLRSTARRYLENQGGRDCVITEGRPLRNQVYEFWYQCAQ